MFISSSSIDVKGDKKKLPSNFHVKPNLGYVRLSLGFDNIFIPFPLVRILVH